MPAPVFTRPPTIVSGTPTFSSETDVAAVNTLAQALHDDIQTRARTADLGTAASQPTTAFASAAQGTKADSAVQPAALTAAVASEAGARDLADVAQTFRPGENPALWSSIFYGEPAGRPPLAIGSVVNSTVGRVVRLTGADAGGVTGYSEIAPRAVFALELNRVYRIRAAVQRITDPGDPAGHSVELRARNMLFDKTGLGAANLLTATPLVANGIVTLERLVCRGTPPASVAGLSVYSAPLDAIYQTPFVRVHGNAHSLDVILLDYTDVTDTLAITVVNSQLGSMPQATVKGRAAGTGTGSPVDLTAAQMRELMNVADGATANATNAELRNRETHTGPQAMATITGLDVALAAKAGTDALAAEAATRGAADTALNVGLSAAEAAARTAIDQSSPLVSSAIAGLLRYIFSFADSSGNQMMGFDDLDRVIDMGFGLRGGPGTPIITWEDSLYRFSIEDEDGNPSFAVDFAGNTVSAGTSGSTAPLVGVDVEGFAAKRMASELPVLEDDDQTYVQVFGTERVTYIGHPCQGKNYASGAAGAGVDVGYLPPNGVVNIELLHDGAYIRSDLGFAGPGANTITRTAGVYTLVRCFRIGQKICYQVLVGSVTTSATTPIRSRSLAFGGQSHIAGGFRQGLAAGVLDGLANARWTPGDNWMPTPIHWTPHCINGATGATAISSVSQPACWWLTNTQTDGPALTTWKSAISAAISAGQPVPEDVIWAQGEGDTWSLSTGALTLDTHYGDLGALFAEMRSWLMAQGAVDPQFYIGILGRGEYEGLQARWQGYTAVRQNYLRLIADRAYVHYACELHDLPGVLGDIHLGFLGHYTHGYRYSRAIANVRGGQSNSLGPVIASATLETDTRRVRLAISGTTLRMPSNPAAPAIFPAGGNAQSTPVTVTSVEVDGTDLIVTADQDLTGCRVLYPAGTIRNPRGDSLVYDLAQSHVKMPGLPLRSYLSDPLA